MEKAKPQPISPGVAAGAPAWAHTVAQLRHRRSSRFSTTLKEGAYAALQLLEVKRLGEVVIRADAHGLLLGVGGAERRDQNHVDIVVISPDGANEVHAIHARHVHVGDHKVT